jgi:hypothetical protein
MAEQLGIDLLAQIPIYMSIRENGDLGTPDTITEWEELAAEVVKRS